MLPLARDCILLVKKDGVLTTLKSWQGHAAKLD